MYVDARQRIGENAITREAGQAIYDAIHPALRQGDEVHLDVAGVKVFASPFLNAAIGQLLRDLSRDELNRLLKIEHITPAGHSTLRVVIDTARERFADGPRAEAVDEAVSRQALAD